MKIPAVTALREGEDEPLKKYAATVEPLVEKAGGKLVSRYEARETLAGSGSVQYVTIVGYPDRSSITSVFQSDDHRGLQAVIKLDFTRYDVHAFY